MGLKKTSKEEIIQESIRLFKTRGYYNTSMSNIADACGLMKGSLYHHFKSKDEIGLESLRFIHEYFEKNVYSIAYDESLCDKEKMQNFVQKIDEYFLKSAGGCLYGSLTLEVSFENITFKKELRNNFKAWEDALAYILKNKYSNDEALCIAKEYIALIQGAVMMMNLHNDRKEYLNVGKKLISLI